MKEIMLIALIVRISPTMKFSEEITRVPERIYY